MDWILIGGIVIACWAVLSVVTGQRLGQAQRAAIILAHAAAQQAKEKDDEIPIAVGNDAALVGSAASFNRKR